MKPTLNDFDQGLEKVRRERLKPRLRSHGELLHDVTTGQPERWITLGRQDRQEWDDLAMMFFQEIRRDLIRWNYFHSRWARFHIGLTRWCIRLTGRGLPSFMRRTPPRWNINN